MLKTRQDRQGKNKKLPKQKKNKPSLGLVLGLHYVGPGLKA
jgi:hypothetical protein